MLNPPSPASAVAAWPVAADLRRPLRRAGVACLLMTAARPEAKAPKQADASREIVANYLDGTSKSDSTIRSVLKAAGEATEKIRRLRK
jgi:hypothetical protein